MKSDNRQRARKSLSDYVYYIGSATKANDYNIITNFLINHIKSTYRYGEDISKALEEKKNINLKKDIPKLQTSDSDDESIREIENRQLEILYKAEIEAFVKRTEEYKSNFVNAYGLIFAQCNKSLQSKIRGKEDFEEKIKNNPIELLRAIEMNATSYQDKRCEMKIVAEAMRTLMNTRQQEKESLVDYTGRFKSARDIFKDQIGGPLIITKYIKANKKDDNDDDEKNESTDKAYRKLMSYIYLENADRAKYGSILKGLEEQFSLGNNQYPTTIRDAQSVLNNHKFDTKSSSSRR